MDEKQVKPVVDMAASGILSVPRARKMFGIPAEDDENHQFYRQAAADPSHSGTSQPLAEAHPQGPCFFNQINLPEEPEMPPFQEVNPSA